MKHWMCLFLLALVTACVSKTNNVHEDFDYQEMIDYTVDKTKSTLGTLSDVDSMPRNVLKGQARWNKVDIHDWTSGFWPGILWYSYGASGDPEILSKAREFTQTLSGILDVPVDNHDLGFMLYNSFGNGLKLTGDSAYASILVRAADSLMTLYNPKVGTILSWPVMRKIMNWPHNTIIDNMMNLELLFWATKYTGDSSYYNAAFQHAETSMKTLIRTDYTTYHVAVFDTTDGHFIRGVTHQGYANNSLWARGQTWGMYGFAIAYRETENKQFLQVACKLADVFTERLPNDNIPYWDFDDPLIPQAPRDASAAAIAASGMLELSALLKENKKAEKYKSAAVHILAELSTDRYLSKSKNPAMLMHSTGHKPGGSEIDASIIYADYYYLEALMKLKKMEKNKDYAQNKGLR